MEFELFQKEVNKYVNGIYSNVISIKLYNVVSRIELVDGAEIKYCEQSDVCVTTSDRVYTLRVTTDSLLVLGCPYTLMFEEKS